MLLAMPALALCAPTLATVTILDGNALVIRDAAKLALVEGARLAKDDILETGASGRLVRLEFTDGVILDFGPDSSALLAPKLNGERGRLPLKIYLLKGWVKVTMPKTGTAAAGAFASPTLDVPGVTRHVVVTSRPGEVMAFAESGEVTLQDRRNPKSPAPLMMKTDDFLSLLADARATITSRPSPAFMQRVPRAFLDSIPPRGERFKGNEPTLKALGDITYADVQPWIDAEPPLRGQFVTRWRAQAQSAEFRKGLIAGLRAHPEWDRTLFPEKYLPKPVVSGHPASGGAWSAPSR
jgi:hypothetical protein